MDNDELRKILDEHKEYIQSLGEKGSKADLQGADLRRANLKGACLEGANLITITNGEYLRVGCQHHPIENWRQFSREKIAEMGGKTALKFYPRLLDILDFHLGKGKRPDWVNKTNNEK